ncbi:MAG: aldehyde dehydrogenase, partial [Thermoguttaceae bacterium]
EMQETKIGRLQHKIEKIKTLGQRAPGVEFLRSEVFSGDHGLAVIEHAPFGVICAITPVTHSLPTITGNAINMIAAGNTLVINPHPGGKRVAAEGVRRYNEAIYRDLGVDNLISLITEPTMESAAALFKHRDVRLILVTGGAAVGRVALQQGKRAIVAGPGNPPVVVDETADLDRAARGIILGCGYDNNLLCIGEKEVFVVDKVFDAMMAAMERAGAVRLNATEIAALTKAAISTVGEGEHRHDVPTKEFIGQDAVVLAKAAGRTISPDVEVVFGETDESNPFVPVEQMMPFLPFVRCRDVDEAIELARKHEHGFRHTAIIHSNNVSNMTKMGKILDTTIFVKNGASVAGLGVGGEGYCSYSIAGPTGEGITTPLTFTRERRCTMVENLRILGKPTC